MTEKDLLYLTDSFNWNLIALKKFKVYKEYSKEAFEMYFDLWGCEDEFVFDPKQNTYVSKEDVEVEMV
mgnify:CR=1 FL=1